MPNEHVAISAANLAPSDLHGVLNALPDGIALLNTQGTVCFANKAWEQQCNDNPAFGMWLAPGKAYCDGFAAVFLLEHTSGPPLSEGVQAVLDGTSPGFTLEHTDATPAERAARRWFITTISPCPINNTRYVLVQQRDVSSQRRAEEALRASEARFGAIFNESLDVIVLGDGKSGRILNVNPVVRDVLGYHAADLIGQHVSVLFSPDRDESAADMLEHLRVHGTVFEAQQFQRADGSTIPMDLTVTMIPLANGMAMLGTLRDVRERRQTEKQLEQTHDQLEARADEQSAELFRSEEALRESQALFHRFIDTSPTIIFAKDLEGRFILTNHLFEEFFGVERNALLGKTNYDIFPELLARSIHDYDQQIIESGEAGEREDIIPHPNGPRIFRVIKFPIYDAQGEVYAIGGISSDVTEQKRAEESLQRAHNMLEQRVAERTTELVRTNNLLRQEVRERARAEQALATQSASLARQVEEQTADLKLANARLERAARLKDEFLANMSHELRTPLNAILGISEALQEEVYGPLTERQHSSLRSIEESGRHLLALINDILDLAKIEAGKTELEFSEVSIEAVCESSLRLIRQNAQKKRLSVSETITCDIPHIRADERRLKQMLVNLLSNAVKFTPDGGSIGIEIVCDEGHNVISFTIWDTGIGIARDDMERLFQPFVQIDSSLSRHYEGSGLGLGLVARLTEMHGGSVGVESELDKGSRFTISLPIIKRETKPPSVSAPEETITTCPRMPPRHIRRALLIEDSLSAAEQITRYLNELGIETTISTQGAQAVEQARNLKPDIIILDILLPDISGWDILATLKTESPTRDIPVLVVSVVDEPELAEKLGAASYLIKPITREQVQAALNTIFPHLRNLPQKALVVVTKHKQSRPTEAPLILLAEDNEENIAMLSDYLNTQGYRVEIVRNGLEALESTRQKHPALILMDIQMPVMDGLEAIRRIRSDSAFAHVPIIALTALAMAGDRERCIKAGASDYMSKPVSLKKLLQMIQSHLAAVGGSASRAEEDHQ
jgi:PAS domain S-box-containing protein